MYRPTYEPPSPSQLNRLNLDIDMENLFSTQEYYAGQSSDQGSGNDYYSGQGSGNDYYAGQGSGQDYYAGQGSGNDYYAGQGSGQDYYAGQAEYDHDFSLEPCWQILKEHLAWKQIEMPAIYAKQNPGGKKAKTFETTSCSAQGGLNFNDDDAAGSDEEVREVRPMGRDQARKKKSSTSSCSEASSAAGGCIVEMVADKCKSYRLEKLGIGEPRKGKSEGSKVEKTRT
nr:hypothetical protein [Tanacetum cinerariifolium]